MAHAIPRSEVPTAHGASRDLALVPSETRRSLWSRLLGPSEAPHALLAPHDHLDIPLIGRVGYYADAHLAGRPMVLIHAIHPGGSAYDIKPLFDAFRRERPTYALDLPGFGTSERGPNTDCPLLCATAIKRFVVDVASPRGLGVDAVALALSGELLARVALEAPSLFRTITLISPTGLDAAARERAPRPRSLVSRVLRAAFGGAPALGLETRRAAIRRTLARQFAGDVPAEYVEHVLRTARAQGARRARASIGDLMGTDDAAEVLYRGLHVPTLLIHDDAPGHDFRRASELERVNPGVRRVAIEGTRGLPHFERMDEVLSAIRDLHEEARRGEEAEARA